MLFESDPIIRQIKQFSQFVAAMSGAVGDVPDDDEVKQNLEDAYLGLIGLDVEFAESLSPDALLRMLHHDAQRRALAELLLAHGDLCRRQSDEAGAMRRWRRAAAVLEQVDDEELQTEVDARVA